jgi:hypothetical protein
MIPRKRLALGRAQSATKLHIVDPINAHHLLSRRETACDRDSAEGHAGHIGEQPAHRVVCLTSFRLSAYPNAQDVGMPANDRVFPLARNDLQSDF